MTTILLNDLSAAQRQRLAYIEFRVWFFGEVTRKDVLDRFGTDIQIFERDEQTFTAVLTTPPRGVRFWALQYLSFVEVVEPAWLRQEIIESIGQNWYSTGER